MDTLDTLAAQLVAAHDGGAPVGEVPEQLVPADRSAVYRLQDKVIGLLGPVGGWKIAVGSEPEPICAPLPKSRFVADGATLDAHRLRLIIAEVEVAVKLGRDIGAGADTGTVEGAIASLHPALEMCGNAFVDRDATPRNIQLGDLQTNGMVVLGAALPDGVRAALDTLPVTLRYDGADVKSAQTGASFTAIVEALLWLSRHAASRGMPLRAGDVIITGARVALPIEAATTAVEGQLGDWGRVGTSLRR